MPVAEEVFTRERAVEQGASSRVIRRPWLWPVAILALVFLAPLAFWLGSRLVSGLSEVRFATPYQAVLLSNGQVYFGRLSGYGGNHPLLTDVYYVQGTVNTQTKETGNTLLKRGSEWHAPDKMWISPNQIILVEPVKPDSRVGQLISQLQNR